MQVGILKLMYMYAIKPHKKGRIVLLTQKDFYISIDSLLSTDERREFRRNNYSVRAHTYLTGSFVSSYLKAFWDKGFDIFETKYQFENREASMYILDILEMYKLQYELIKTTVDWISVSSQNFISIIQTTSFVDRLVHGNNRLENKLSFISSEVKKIIYNPFDDLIIIHIGKNIYHFGKKGFKLVEIISDATPKHSTPEPSLPTPKPQTYDEKISSLDELFKRSADYKNSENFKAALQFVVQLKTVAPFNAWLLREQNPDITYVATANDWAYRFNRSIKPKARAYVVMNHSPVGFVYDVLDTEGDELPADLKSHFRAEGILHQEIMSNTIECCHKKKITVRYDKTIPLSLAGRASHDQFNNTRTITINADHSIEVQFSTLCHEIAHLMLGHLGEFPDCQCKSRTNLLHKVREIEAESVSWLVCDRLGIKTDAERYLNGYLTDSSLLEDISINNILITAGRIESMALKKECNVKKINPSKTQKTLL